MAYPKKTETVDHPSTKRCPALPATPGAERKVRVRFSSELSKQDTDPLDNLIF